MSQGNSIAYIAILMWPLIAFYLYKVKQIQSAIFWTIMGGFLTLPVLTKIDFPLIPPLDKSSISVLSAMFGVWFIAHKRVAIFSSDLTLKLFVLLIFMSPALTVMTNKEAINLASHYLPGLSSHDTFSISVNTFLFIFPFFLGRRFFSRYEDQFVLFKMLMFAGIFYSLFVLYEVRMSPHLHTSLYGYFPHDYIQQKRFGGFRPVVFIGHGLQVSFFITMVLISSVFFMVNRAQITRFTPKLLTFYLLIVLVVCKSISSIVYGIFALITIKLLSVKRVMSVAFIIATLAILYPTLSINNLFPHDEVVSLAASFSEDRAGSLQFRFDNEEILLEHANKKSLFGWGGWGRNLIYNDVGRDISVTDGTWIIQFSQFGWLGFISLFGLIYLTVLKANRSYSLLSKKNEQSLLAVHALIVAIIMIDQLPNSSLAPWLWLIIGSLYGRCENITSEYKANSQL